MCGISGVASAHPDQPIDRAMLGRMTRIVQHRGPDSQGFHLAPGIGLGVQRLAINDLETGDQPISNADETVTVVCNGEIYNFVELRRELVAAGHRFRTGSDVEVIVHLYEDRGADCVDRLRGMFAFALWDAPRRRLMLARDRLGIKPLHYAITRDGCYFGSESKSILIADRIDRQIDVRALRELFTLGFALAPKTFFTEIQRLQPGHYLLYRDGRASLHRYWELDPAQTEAGDGSRSPEGWAEALLEKLDESVRLHLRGDVPVGAWLSPGIDSSGVTALMSRFAPSPVRTFSLAFEEPDHDEIRGRRTLADFPSYPLSGRRVVCRTADFALFPEAIWHSEDPSLTGHEIPMMLLARAAADHVKVVLTGEGSDELFGGYAWFRADRLLRPLARLPLSLRRMAAAAPLFSRRWPGASRILLAPSRMNLTRYQHMIAPLQSDLPGRLFSPDLEQMLTRDGLDEPPRPTAFETWHPFTQLQHYEMNVRLPDWIVRQLDRSSMAYSLEARVPFLDHELVELCARIPARLKARGPRDKPVLRRALASVLPPEIVRRRKRGMTVPVEQWFRSPLPDFATELLARDSLADKGYFSPGGVVRMLEEHRAGRGEYGHYLLGVLGVQLWDEHFVRGCRPPGGA